jgi:hypothetical protein
METGGLGGKSPSIWEFIDLAPHWDTNCEDLGDVFRKASFPEWPKSCLATIQLMINPAS